MAQWCLIAAPVFFFLEIKPFLLLFKTPCMFLHPSRYFMFKVNKINTRARYEIYSKLTIKTPERCHWCRSGVFSVNFEHISHLVLMSLFLNLNIFKFFTIFNTLTLTFHCLKGKTSISLPMKRKKTLAANI